jgi:hypothetical protein
VKLNRWLLAMSGNGTLCCICCALCLAAVNAVAGSAHTSFGVSVTVQPVVHVEQLAHGALLISAQDVQRGYVEVTNPVTMHIASNSAAGYTLDVLPTNDVFTQVIVHGLDNEVALGAEGGMIVQRWQHAQTVALNLRFQFALRQGVQPGEYAFPLHMTVRPL